MSDINLNDEPLEEIWNDPKDYKEGTYIHPYEYSFSRYPGNFTIKLTKQGELLMRVIRRHLMKEVE